MKEIATIRFVDRETADEGVAFVRADAGSVALSLSLRADGDIQVLLVPEDCERLAVALDQAVRASRTATGAPLE